MPALPPVANVIKSRMFWAVEGDPAAVTILYWHYTGSPPEYTDLLSWVTALTTSAETNLLPLAGTGIQLVAIDGADLSAMDGAMATVDVAMAGTRTGTRLAPGTAAVVNYTISQRYRGGKPRSYFPFGVSGDVASTGLWADAFVTAVNSGFALYQETGESTHGGLTVDTQCVVSYYGPPNKVITNPTTGRARTVSTRRDAAGGTGHPLTYLIDVGNTSKVIGSQRRRNRNA